MWAIYETWPHRGYPCGYTGRRRQRVIPKRVTTTTLTIRAASDSRPEFAGDDLPRATGLYSPVHTAAAQCTPPAHSTAPPTVQCLKRSFGQRFRNVSNRPKYYTVAAVASSLFFPPRTGLASCRRRNLRPIRFQKTLYVCSAKVPTTSVRKRNNILLKYNLIYVYYHATSILVA